MDRTTKSDKLKEAERLAKKIQGQSDEHKILIEGFIAGISAAKKASKN